MNEDVNSFLPRAEIDGFKEKYGRLIENFHSLKTSQHWHSESDICFAYKSIRVRKFHGSRNQSSPVLIVYSHVNYPHVIDLTPRKSLVCRLIEAGHKVFLIEWGEVNEEARIRDLSVYMHDYIDHSVDFILQECDVDKVDLIGICQGGTFGLCYASLHPKKIRSLVTMVTPVDFQAGESIIWKWSRKLDFSQLETNPINIPGELITLFFQSLRPFEEIKRSIRLIQNSGSTDNLKLTGLVDRWVFECPDQPGKSFAQFMHQFYQENRLVRGGLDVGEHTVNLRNIECSVLNLYATADHLVPPESASALKYHISQDNYHEIAYDGGHIGLMIGAKSHQRILPEMTKWLANNRK